MTRMAENDEQDLETYDEEASRSIFSALWFRALVVVLVLGVVAAVAVPYALDVMTPPAGKSTVALRPAASPPPAAAPPQPAPPVPAPTSTTAPAPTVAAEPSRPAATRPEPPKPEAMKPEPARPAPLKPESPKPTSPPRVAEAPKVAEPPKPVEPAKPAEASKPADVSKPVQAARPVEVTKPEVTKPAEAAKPAAPPRVAVAPPVPRASATATAGAPYWVQVGAFKDEGTARRLADKLREQNFAVEQSARTRGGAKVPVAAAPGGASMTDERYNVFVSGLAPSELSTRLTAKGLASQAVAGGVMVTPSMPLREAVALSKDLAGDGLRVQVRRVASAAGAGNGPSPSASPSPGGETVYRVRVGGFADRAAAIAAAKELEAKGFKVYVARGNQ
jgi:cell division septation protein DedD